MSFHIISLDVGQVTFALLNSRSYKVKRLRDPHLKGFSRIEILSSGFGGATKRSLSTDLTNRLMLHEAKLSASMRQCFRHNEAVSAFKNKILKSLSFDREIECSCEVVERVR